MEGLSQPVNSFNVSLITPGYILILQDRLSLSLLTITAVKTEPVQQ